MRAWRSFARETEPQGAYAAVEAQARRFAAALGFEIEADAPVWHQFPPRPHDTLSLYEAVKALSDGDLEGLHTLLIALAFGQGDCNRLDSGDTLFNRVARDLGADMRAYWRPDAAFLSRRTRAQLIQIVEESGLIDRLPDARSMKKAELVSNAGAAVRACPRPEQPGGRRSQGPRLAAGRHAVSRRGTRPGKGGNRARRRPRRGAGRAAPRRITGEDVS